jgi:fumarate reductase subunit D
MFFMRQTSNMIHSILKAQSLFGNGWLGRLLIFTITVALARWCSGHRLRHLIARSWVRISPGSKVRRTLCIAMLFSVTLFAFLFCVFEGNKCKNSKKTKQLH